jgi:hypothetical protein
MYEPHSLATLHVRNVPEELYLRLRRRAESAQRSVSAEVVTLLDQLSFYPKDLPGQRNGKVGATVLDSIPL